MFVREIVLAILLSCLCFLPSKAHVGLDFPVGGEVFFAGNTINIQWTEIVPHNTENWDLLYSDDNGISWDTIFKDLPTATLNIDWQLPLEITGQGVIKVIQDNTGQDYEDMSSAFSIESLLSVTIKQFDVSLQATGKVEINWKTSSEIGNEWFAVQRSAKGGDFTTIKKIAGAGHSNLTLDYQHIDASPEPGFNLYRIQSISHDGEIEFFNVESIYVPTPIELSPNPTMRSLWINNYGDQSTTWKIIDSKDNVIKVASCSGNLINTPCEVNLDYLPPGLYFVQGFGGQKLSRAFTKL